MAAYQAQTNLTNL